jgi:hypothetical protein
MKFVRPAWLIMVAAACSKSEGAPETLMKASSDTPAVATAATVVIPLEELITQLDTVHGFYWPKTPRRLELTNAELHPERFRPHGKAAVQRLIDCMTDTASTAVYYSDDMDYKYPRGVLCYEVLRALVDYDQSRYLPINREDVYVSMTQGNVLAELQRGRRAWQVIHNANAYRLRTFTP